MILGFGDVPPGTKVAVDGKTIPEVFECDLLEGTVSAYAMDDDGQLIVEGEELVEVKHKGQITITCPETTHGL